MRWFPHPSRLGHGPHRTSEDHGRCQHCQDEGTSSVFMEGRPDLPQRLLKGIDDATIHRRLPVGSLSSPSLRCRRPRFSVRVTRSWHTVTRFGKWATQRWQRRQPFLDGLVDHLSWTHHEGGGHVHPHPVLHVRSAVTLHLRCSRSPQEPAHHLVGQRRHHGVRLRTTSSTMCRLASPAKPLPPPP